MDCSTSVSVQSLTSPSSVSFPVDGRGQDYGNNYEERCGARKEFTYLDVDGSFYRTIYKRREIKRI